MYSHLSTSNRVIDVFLVLRKFIWNSFLIVHQNVELILCSSIDAQCVHWLFMFCANVFAESFFFYCKSTSLKLWHKWMYVCVCVCLWLQLASIIILNRTICCDNKIRRQCYVLKICAHNPDCCCTLCLCAHCTVYTHWFVDKIFLRCWIEMKQSAKIFSQHWNTLECVCVSVCLLGITHCYI